MHKERIVVGVDGSPGGNRALDWALSHAARTGADLTVVTAFTYDGPAEALDSPGSAGGRTRASAARRQRAALADALLIVADPPPVTTKILPGDAAGVLADESFDADLLIVGSHGHGAVETRLLGSVSTHCLRWAACPVVVVPAPHYYRHDRSGVTVAGRIY